MIQKKKIKGKQASSPLTNPEGNYNLPSPSVPTPNEML
ncbi:hypothetical protein PEDI_19110 [Persicobacter diffluens]|uniref:Uncharacterized protein n=1 Tax=Persicobacter diffluens TaxID=981 RepID=A0AAN5AJT6_9BACT|nr:hypothetical protein PEDI_19110 [Persicobacter diffluens]